jgi:hypothetical protein
MEHTGMPHRGLELDRHTAERLVAGDVAADDAPPAYAAVAELLDAAAGPAGPAEQGDLEDEAAVRAMFARHRDDPSTGVGAPGPRRLRPVRVAAIAVGALALTGATAAAAATGHLPAPVQAAVSDLVSHVGITIPHSPEAEPAPSAPDHAPPTTVPAEPSTQPGAGETVCDDASDGTCRAGEQGRAGEDHPRSTAPSTTPGQTPTTGPPTDPGNSKGDGRDPTRPAPPTTGPPTSPPAGPPITPPSTVPGGRPEGTPGVPPTSPPSTKPEVPATPPTTASGGPGDASDDRPSPPSRP